jgi:multidrug efflux pump subunit AcrB
MVFGLFNLGAQESIILLLGASCFAGFIASIVVLVVLLTRRQGRDGVPNRQAATEAENLRLREELAKIKKDRT